MYHLLEAPPNSEHLLGFLPLFLVVSPPKAGGSCNLGPVSHSRLSWMTELGLSLGRGGLSHGGMELLWALLRGFPNHLVCLSGHISDPTGVPQWVFQPDTLIPSPSLRDSG